MTSTSTKKKVLFNTQFHWNYAAVDYTLAVALQQRGCDVVMLACGGGLPCYCEQENQRHPRPDCQVCLQRICGRLNEYGLPFTTVKEYLGQDDYTLADKLCRNYSVESLLQCELLGVPVGRLARLNLFQYYHGFPFSITGPKEESFRRIFHSAVLYTLAQKRVVDQYQPDMVISANGKFLQWAPIIHFARQKNCRFATWEDLDPGPGIGLAVNGIAHEQRIDEVWAEESQKKLNEQERQDLWKHFKLWAGGKLLSTPYYQEDAEYNQDNIRRRLNLIPNQPIISLFPNVSWDSTSVGFETAFESIYDWIFSCVDYAIAHPEINLIVRSHPGELKLPESHRIEILTCETVRNKYGILPNNIKLIEPDSNIPSYAIANISDVCMVYTSTMGVELACQGKKVWVAANSYYKGKGFTVDLQSREQMYKLLDQRSFDNTLTPNQVMLAEKFAHIVRFRRVFQLPYLDIAKRRYNFPGRQAYAPGANPVVDKMCNYVLTGRPFLDIGRDVPVDPVFTTVASDGAKEYVYQNLKIHYDSLPSLQTEIKNIFEQKIYDFKTDKQSPLVIDGGAHLGLFTLYIKQKYPQARVIAFEPDERAFTNLNANLTENHCSAVHTIKSGLFNKNTTLHFASNGADGGAIKSDGAAQIQVVKLSDYITEPVDYLKLNIEGAELEVLEDIEPKLHLVNELCLEYHGFPEIGQRLHRILALLDRNGFRYLIHDFDKETNPATKPPFSISPKSRFYLLIYAKRIYAKTNLPAAEPLKLLDSVPCQANEGGDLARTEPVSRKFGLDRGKSICRYYIEKYLSENRHHIRGRVLEIGGRRYTKQYGVNVTQSDILHAVPSPEATIVGDLATGENIPGSAFDCIILTQVLECIYDVKAAVKNAVRALRPGGTLLITDNGIGPISRYDMDRWGDYWRFTDKSLKSLLTECLPQESIAIQTYGNVAAAKAYLDGRCAEELTPAILDVQDKDYQSVITAVAVKPAAVSKQSPQNPAVALPISQQPVALLYHRVADETVDAQYLAVSPINFEQHLRDLKNHYRVVPLRQLLQETSSGTSVPNTVALTFDDGYLDNLSNALPLLEKYQIHATVFATAGNIEQSRGFWGDKIEYLFLHHSQLPAKLEMTEDDKDHTWPLTTPQERLVAHDQIRAILKKKPNNEIEPFVAELLRWGCITDNLDTFRPVLNIAQLQRLSQSPYIEIGAHTMSHSRLSILPIHLQQWEIEQSRKKLESWIGKPVTIFSYPYGAKADFTTDTKTLVQQVGFQYGIANSQGSISSNMDPFEVPRRLVRNWQGGHFADWMRSPDKDLLEKQTLARRIGALVQVVDSRRQNCKNAGQECVITG